MSSPFKNHAGTMISVPSIIEINLSNKTRNPSIAEVSYVSMSFESLSFTAFLDHLANC